MSLFNVRDFGAGGLSLRSRLLHCPARTHAGWHAGADLHAEIFDPAAPGADLPDQIAIQQAIDAAHSAGGGRVLVPPGKYLIAPLRLRSGVDLHLEAGAELLGLPDLACYQAAGPDASKDADPALVTQGQRRGGMTGRVLPTPLLVAENCSGLSLSGSGTISQQSGAFFIPWWAAEKSYELTRPSRMIRFTNCTGVRVGGIRLRDSCGWTLTFDRCEDVQVRDLVIRNGHGPNVDGIDIVDSRQVVIENCDIFTTDDAICLKSFHPEGCVERVRVRGCFIRTLCNAFKIGTESVGHFRDIMVSDLQIYNREDDPHDAAAALALCCMDGGTIENVSLTNIQVRGARTAFYFVVGRRTVHQQEFRSPRAGCIRQVSLTGLTSSGAQLPSFISGLPGNAVSDIHLSRLRMQTESTVDIWPESVPMLPEAYPAPSMFGMLPASGLFAREVEGLVLRDTRLQAPPEDLRPACAFADVSELVRDNSPPPA